MAWRSFTRNDLLTGLMGAEADAYGGAALEAGQVDPLAEIISQVTAMARGYIADCPSNRLAAGETLPERVIYHIVPLVRERYAKRLDIRHSDERQDEVKESIRFLERVADCKVKLELPEGEMADDSSAETVEVVSPPTRRVTQDSLSGL